MNEHLKRSRAQEKRGARQLGGTVNSGSGNGIWRKNDVRSARFSAEYKTTLKQQYPLKRQELLTAYRNALLDGRTMIFGLDIADSRWIVLAEEDFLALLDEAEEDP